MESDAHAGILPRRFETAEFLLMRRIGKIENDETIAAKRAVAAIAALFQSFRYVDRAMETRKRSLIGNDSWRNQL